MRNGRIASVLGAVALALALSISLPAAPTPGNPVPVGAASAEETGGRMLPPKPVAGPHAAQTLPGFQESVVFSGLSFPTAIRFAPNGKIFVAEKRGTIKVFDSISDTTPTIAADIRTNVHNFWDRGLLGMALHPQFPTNSSIYVLYTYDAPIGGTAPAWGQPDTDSDPCPNPPGATADGCVVSGRLSRLQLRGDIMTGSEQVLINDWCQQYPSHSMGSLVFGADGALYVSAGEGAHMFLPDYGQDGNPLNPCGDPPAGVGGVQTAPTAEGGSLRSQDLRTAGDPVGLSGTILRLDPDTGLALPTNPLFASADANARRIIAYGLRNPFRMTLRPGTNEIWIGDVGDFRWEEINRISNPTDPVVKNFGWPCYEGAARQPNWDGLNVNICEDLYSQAGAVTDPYFSYFHNDILVPSDSCPKDGASITGLAFYPSGPYAGYEGALFFADYTRNCIWVMFKNSGVPPIVCTGKGLV